jgi:precorrin-3B C17-methyltransferase
MAVGKVMVIGIGPGSPEYLTQQGRKALEESELVVGYQLYLKQVEELIAGKEIAALGMGSEIKRCCLAAEEAAKGKKVALISGGDPGIYGMAGLLLQVVQGLVNRPEVEIIAGLTVAGAAAALLGAPLMHDFAVISLSDLLVPWSLIEKRLYAAAEADLVTVLYNPRSRSRTKQLILAREIFLQYRQGDAPVGIVRNAGREGQAVLGTTLAGLLAWQDKIDMVSVVFIGNSSSYWHEGRMFTPRGYRL